MSLCQEGGQVPLSLPAMTPLNKFCCHSLFTYKGEGTCLACEGPVLSTRREMGERNGMEGGSVSKVDLGSDFWCTFLTWGDRVRRIPEAHLETASQKMR